MPRSLANKRRWITAATLVSTVVVSGWLSGFATSVNDIFRASFTNIPPGSKSFSTEVGTLTAFTVAGLPVQAVAPEMGVSTSGEYKLTNQGGLPGLPFGIVCEFMRVNSRGLYATFLVRADATNHLPDIDAEVTDTTGIDMTRMSLFGDGQFSVSGDRAGRQLTSFAPSLKVEIQLTDSPSGPDRFTITISSRDTGQVLGGASGNIPGGYRPAKYLTFKMNGVTVDTAYLDDILVRDT